MRSLNGFLLLEMFSVVLKILESEVRKRDTEIINVVHPLVTINKTRGKKLKCARLLKKHPQSWE